MQQQQQQQDIGELYAVYIMSHAPGDRVICNGDTLLIAMEDGYLWEAFCDANGIDPDTEY